MPKAIISIFLLLSLSLVSFSQDFDSDSYRLNDTHNKWSFRFGPYFWLLGIEGSIIKPPQPSNLPEYSDRRIDIDWDFYEVLNSLKFACMFLSEYRSEHWVAKLNFSSLILESNVLTDHEILIKNGNIRYTYIGTDLSFGYRIIKNPAHEFNTSFGAKLAFFKVDLNTKIFLVDGIHFVRDHLLLEPALAMRYIYRPHTRVELSAYVDVGSRLLDDAFSYQLQLGGKYVFSKHFSSGITFRRLYYNADLDKGVFDGAIHGPTINVLAQF
ncbi:hypothetical protein [Saccharicrinis aurantiacus]|uniref:hypothetical protein n=1 Tax=Saccharicrinis aurantiacus TaxID=1849719 RepID=UPI0024922DF8|nr:hypothetical protein [Saccharicrinis aurantiacus]